MINIGVIASQGLIKLLDINPAVLALSLRKIRTAYSGYVLKVRRSSDNATTDVSFDSNGSTSGSSPVSAGGNLTTWMGSDNVFVDTWYDQSVNGNNAVQLTAANQPQLAASGVIYTQNSKPTINFNNSSVHYWDVADSASLDLDVGLSSFWVGTTADTTTTRVFSPYDKRVNSSPFRGYTTFFGNGPQRCYAQWNADAVSATNATASFSTDTLMLLSLLATRNSSATFYKNNSSLGTGSLSSVAGTSINTEALKVGIAASVDISNNIYGKYSELIIFNTSLSAANLNAVNRSIMSYYGIT